MQYNTVNVRQHRISATGSTTFTRHRDVHVTCEFTGIKEALQTGAKLTHKQARIARKLIAKVTPASLQQRKGKKTSPTLAGGLKTVEEVGASRQRLVFLCFPVCSQKIFMHDSVSLQCGAASVADCKASDP